MYHCKLYIPCGLHLSCTNFTNLEVSDHFFFLAKNSSGTIHTVEMLPVAKVFAV